MFIFLENYVVFKGRNPNPLFCYSEFFFDVVDGITRLPCKCNWCQFEVIGNDALWNSLPETDYIYTVAGLYKRVILLLKWYGFF